jgi:hypothetical protein
MIDTYFDRADAATNWKRTRDHKLQEIYDDRRYFQGNLYSTMIDRNVAEAKFNLCAFINERVSIEKSITARDFFPLFHKDKQCKPVTR